MPKIQIHKIVLGLLWAWALVAVGIVISNGGSLRFPHTLPVFFVFGFGLGAVTICLFGNVRED